jgi:putative FmdB family regulatory protein
MPRAHTYNRSMPTYEYVCSSCGAHIEVYQRFSDEPLSECGVCGGQLRKVFHPAGILFKGSGFYKTDSRSAAKSKAGTPKNESKPEKAVSSAGSDSSSTSTRSADSSAKSGSSGKEKTA